MWIICVFCFQFLFSFLFLLLFVSCICRYHLIVDNKSFFVPQTGRQMHAHTCTHKYTHTHIQGISVCVCSISAVPFVTLRCIYSVFCILCSVFSIRLSFYLTNRCFIFFAILFLSLFNSVSKKTSIKTIDCNRIISANFHLSKLSAVIGWSI